jgi:hypothetical protein
VAAVEGSKGVAVVVEIAAAEVAVHLVAVAAVAVVAVVPVVREWVPRAARKLLW